MCASRSPTQGTQAQLRAAVGERVDHLVEVHADAAGLLRVKRPERRSHAAQTQVPALAAHDLALNPPLNHTRK